MCRRRACGQIVWACHQKTLCVADGVLTVRSRATGTPVASLFGVDGAGRGFDILTIDTRGLEDGGVVRTYHVEDWAGAIQQLSGG